MAECVRTVENIASFDFKYRIDHPTFDKTSLKKDLPVVSPKLTQLIQHIQQLDAKDKAKDGHLYKHMIFSDLKAEGGAKTIAGALIAHGFKLVYDKNLTIHLQPGTHNFAMLCSTKIYGKEVGVRFRRELLGAFNNRPDNIHGDNIRFIVLDYGFKEGIDLFDIKYIHILETPVTLADQKQIVGRGTRFCGQKGLTFDEGWPLYVYIYQTILPERLQEKYEAKTLFDLFLRLSNIDQSKDAFGKELEKRCIQASVDFSLNQTIHQHNPAFKQLQKEVADKYASFFVLDEDKHKAAHLNCAAGCKGAIVQYPTDLLLLLWYSLPKATVLREKWPRATLCQYLVENKTYCKRVNEAIGDYPGYILKHKIHLLNSIQSVPQRIALMRFIDHTLDAVDRTPEPPTKPMRYYDLQAFMMYHFKRYAWPAVKMENLCVSKAGGEGMKSIVQVPGPGAPAFEFTPTQLTLQTYFQPANPYKGMLLWHSTGVGKTCTGISVATNSFEKEGYTILWVTRHTLIPDIWKNIQSCSRTLTEKLPALETLQNPLKYLSARWVQPLTYKQFSNLLQGKNQFYQDMVARNGEKDPLKKTLIIIDEAHKLLSGDLKPQERPDFEVLKRFIHNSYTISKKDSVRLLLMTATPYTTNPYSLIRLLNLIRPVEEQLVEDPDIFNTHYLNTKYEFKYPLEFLDQITGYISYLNREADIRQFAKPMISTIPVPLSEKNTDILEQEYQQAQQNVMANEMEKEKAKVKLAAEKKQLKKLVSKKEADKRAKAFAKELFQEADTLIAENKERMKELKKAIERPDASQESKLAEKCLKS